MVKNESTTASEELKEAPPVEGEKEERTRDLSRREETENFETLYEESFKEIADGQILK